MLPRMRRLGAFFLLALGCSEPQLNEPDSGTALTVTRTRTELLEQPLGIGTRSPRFSWVLESSRRGAKPAGYRIEVATSELLLRAHRADLWDSGAVDSVETSGIVYRGKSLPSRQLAYWRVKAWDDRGAIAESATSRFETGLLEAADWTASWIAPKQREGAATRPASRPYATVADKSPELAPARLLHKRFAIDKPITRARLYASALGLYEARLNGVKIGNGVLDPGWTDYTQAVPYQCYDLGAELRQGENVLGAMLADGWYAGYVGWGRQRSHYGSDPALVMELIVDHVDGSTTRVATDASWRSGDGPILAADLLMGETYDARNEIGGWDSIGGPDLPYATTVVQPNTRLRAQVGPQMARTQELKAKAMQEPKPGIHVFDLGQNIVGWARLAVRAAAGTRVQLRFAEVVEPDGTLYTKNLRLATATDVYVTKGSGIEVWEPSFTFHGFRYVEVTGLSERPALEAVTGIVVHSELRSTLRFRSNDPWIDKLHENIEWGQRGNFLGVPTDCPQRDERLGWMGDAQIFVRTACLLTDAQGFYEKWLQDVMESQSPEGAFPDVAPRIAHKGDGAPAWGDAGVIVPWALWRAYGDRGTLAACYPSMRRWVEYVLAANPDLIWKNKVANNYGDWLQVGVETPKDLIATAYFAHSAELVGRAASALGKATDAERFMALAGKIKSAFCAAFLAEDGKLAGDTQTAYVLALRFALVPEQRRKALADHLARDVVRRGNKLTTGFVGAGHLLPALSEAGRSELAHALMLQDQFPSWLYTVKNGATTIWERWDGWRHDKGFQDPGMNSFNHYAFGAVGEWLYGNLAGIAQAEDSVGWDRIVIRPEPGKAFVKVEAAYESRHGWIESRWRIDGERFHLDVRIPVGATAVVHVPTHDAMQVSEGALVAQVAPGVRYLGFERGVARFEVGSGRYEFTAPRRSGW